MKNYLRYIAIGVVGLASLLPVYGCGHSNPLKSKANEDHVVDLLNVRTTIDGILSSANPSSPGSVGFVEVILGNIPEPVEIQAVFEVGARLYDDLQIRYGPSGPLVIPRLENDVDISPYRRDRVFVGRASNHPLIAKALSELPDPQDQSLPGAGTGVIFAASASTGALVIIVTGTTDNDVKNAGRAFNQYDNRYGINNKFMDLNGAKIYVTGPDIGDLTTTVVK